MNIKAAIDCVRFPTVLPNAAGLINGVLLAAAEGSFDPLTGLLVVLTGCLVSNLSSVADELGDFLHGNDTADYEVSELAPKHPLAKGRITVPQVKGILITFLVLSCAVGLLTVRRAFGTLFALLPLAMIGLGALCIVGAMRYTLGKNPYGYRGLGDPAVFILCGPILVFGAYFACKGGTPPFDWRVILPAISHGIFISVMLNINNIRDIEKDRATRKTIAIRLGERRARIYGVTLIALSMTAPLIYTLVYPTFTPLNLLYLLSYPFFILAQYGTLRYRGAKINLFFAFNVTGALLFGILHGLGYYLPTVL